MISVFGGNGYTFKLFQKWTENMQVQSKQYNYFHIFLTYLRFSFAFLGFCIHNFFGWILGQHNDWPNYVNKAIITNVIISIKKLLKCKP